MTRRIALYGGALAAGTALLQWLDWRRTALLDSGALYGFLLATGFLALGLWAGHRLSRPFPLPAGNPAATAALGLSNRELEVLHALAAGQSNKEIARTLAVSPNTVKTHVSRVYEKLEARRRTEAVMKARELGIL
jgi:DNA-binding CsgD family transcriptional regulator